MDLNVQSPLYIFNIILANTQKVKSFDKGQLKATPSQLEGQVPQTVEGAKAEYSGQDSRPCHGERWPRF